MATSTDDTELRDVKAPAAKAPARTRNGRGPLGRKAAAPRMARPRQAQASRMSELERIIEGLETRIAELTSRNGIRSTIHGATDQMGSAVNRASHQVGDMVADTLAEFAERLRGGATSVTSAARVGTGAMQRIGAELEKRPFMTVAIALGIGFLAGLAGRREEP